MNMRRGPTRWLLSRTEFDGRGADGRSNVFKRAVVKARLVLANFLELRREVGP